MDEACPAPTIKSVFGTYPQRAAYIGEQRPYLISRQAIISGESALNFSIVATIEPVLSADPEVTGIIELKTENRIVG